VVSPPTPEIFTWRIPHGWEPLIYPEAAATVCMYVNYAISSHVVLQCRRAHRLLLDYLQGPTDDAIYLCVCDIHRMTVTVSS